MEWRVWGLDGERNRKDNGKERKWGKGWGFLKEGKERRLGFYVHFFRGFFGVSRGFGLDI